MQTVEIACCFDQGFAFPAAVLATSILAHAQPDRSYRLHGLYDGDDDVGPALFEAFANTRLNVEVQKIRNPFTGIRTSRRTLSAAAFVRLALPELLPNCGRVLYLDADTLCVTDIAALFDTELSGAPIAAAVDPPMANILAFEKRGGMATAPGSFTEYLHRDLGLGRASTDYFNSGVLVLDLERLRNEGMTARARELLTRRGHVIRLDDQCVLNALYAMRYHKLPSRWNAMLCPPRWTEFSWSGVELMTRVAQSFHQPAVLHFCQNTKPWIRNCHETTYASVWRAYALAAPLPLGAKLRQIASAPRISPRYAKPSVQAQAAEIRSALRHGR